MESSINTPAKTYIASLSKFHSNLSQELIIIPEFNQQLEANINKDSDFEGIEKYIKDAKSDNYFSEEDKVLIVDYENVAFATYERNGKVYKLNISKYDNIPMNISDDEVIRYRSATYFILNYAFKRKYKHVFIVCKTPQSSSYFEQDYKAIKEKGEIILGIPTKKVDNAITTFKCDEIKNWLSEPTPKCTLFKINNNDSLIQKLNSPGLKKLGVHALQGSHTPINGSPCSSISNTYIVRIFNSFFYIIRNIRHMFSLFILNLDC